MRCDLALSPDGAFAVVQPVTPARRPWSLQVVSLSDGASRAFGFAGLQQVIVSMYGGYMFVSSISLGSALGVVATSGCDIGAIGYQTSLLVERAGELLTPELISELRVSVLS